MNANGGQDKGKKNLKIARCGSAHRHRYPISNFLRYRYRHPIRISDRCIPTKYLCMFWAMSLMRWWKRITLKSVKPQNNASDVSVPEFPQTAKETSDCWPLTRTQTEWDADLERQQQTSVILVLHHLFWPSHLWVTPSVTKLHNDQCYRKH